MSGVTRVPTATGSHVEPPLDADWDFRKQLAWQLGVVHADHGLRLTLTKFPNNWCVSGPGVSSSVVVPRYRELDTLWGVVNYIALGYGMAQHRYGRQDVS